MRDITRVLCKSRNGTRGLKAGSSFSAFNAALKGPLFHDVISGIARGECITWIELVEERRFSAALALPTLADGLQRKSDHEGPCESETFVACSRKTVHGA